MDKELKLYTYLNILYVEDDPVLRFQTILQLKPILPNLIFATNGQEGIDIFKKYFNSGKLDSIKLIITDIEMPNKNGLEMIVKIKEISPSIPIIIVSAHDQTDYFLKAIELGVEGFILKPYTINEILSILNKTIEKHYKEEENESRRDKHNILNSNIVHIGAHSYYNISQEQLYYNDVLVKLSTKEGSLLKLLIHANGKCVSYRTIEHIVWPNDSINSDSLRALMYRLRTKIEANLIETIPSFGYKLSYLTSSY